MMNISGGRLRNSNIYSGGIGKACTRYFGSTGDSDIIFSTSNRWVASQFRNQSFYQGFGSFISSGSAICSTINCDGKFSVLDNTSWCESHYLSNRYYPSG